MTCSGRIVVGVDASEGSAVALRWALEEARLRGSTVEVVHAWHYPYLASCDITGMAPAGLSLGDLEAGERAVLDRAVAAGGTAPEGVTVNPILADGGAAEVLLEAAVGADLLVVGSRGHGGFAGLLLGSVSEHCVHHSPCPVVVVPHGRPTR
ncbi:MAG TPA: universal stress protein [Nocardioidaceae bacterium]